VQNQTELLNIHCTRKSCPHIRFFSIDSFSYRITAVYCSPKKKFGKLNKLMVHKFQNMHQARTGHNMVKSSSPNAPSIWLIFLCPHIHTKMSESLTFTHMRKRQEVHCKCTMQCTVHCKCTMQCTVHCKCTMQCTVHFIITVSKVCNVLLCVIYQLNFTIFMYVVGQVAQSV
jgi:hypothetical protein